MKTWVYFFASAGRIKIGFTSNPTQRLVNSEYLAGTGTYAELIALAPWRQQ